MLDGVELRPDCRVFFTSDPHFYHKNAIRHSNRPFRNVDEMNAGLIQRWNQAVRPGDIVFVLGDVFFCGVQRSKEIMDQLNGIKILIMGNHDDTPKRMTSRGFNLVYNGNLEGEIAGKRLILSHYPYAPTKRERFFYKLRHFWKFWRRVKYKELRYMDRRPIDQGGWLLHGHVHTAWKFKRKMINVGVDVWDYTPVPLSTIERIIKDSDKI